MSWCRIGAAVYIDNVGVHRTGVAYVDAHRITGVHRDFLWPVICEPMTCGSWLVLPFHIHLAPCCGAFPYPYYLL